MTERERTFPCDYCGTEGRLYRTRSGHPNDPDTIDAGECPVCQGACSVDAETFLKQSDYEEDDPLYIEAMEIVEAEKRRKQREEALLRVREGDSAVAAINDEVPF